MTRLTDTTLKGRLKEPRAAQAETVDGAVPGIAVRLGRGPAATWSLVLRVRGEGGVSRRGFAIKRRRYRFTLGNYPVMSLEAARARANAGESPASALERAAAGGLTVGAAAKPPAEPWGFYGSWWDGRPTSILFTATTIPGGGSKSVSPASAGAIGALRR